MFHLLESLLPPTGGFIPLWHLSGLELGCLLISLNATFPTAHQKDQFVVL